MKLNALSLLVAGLALLASLGALALKPEAPKPPLGAIPGSSLEGPEFSVAGVTLFSKSDSLNRSSTSLCALRSPSATSTLRFGSVTLTTGTTTGIAIELGKGNQFDATTTSLGYAVLASLQRATLTASTTSSGVDLTNVFSPNQYLVAKYGGALGTQNVLVGSCKAEWLVN